MILIFLINVVFTQAPVRYETKIGNQDFVIFDAAWSGGTALFGVAELSKDHYRISNLHFQPGDVVIDIGACIGQFSLMLAKRYPFLRIYSFEPVKENFDNMVRNIASNNIPHGTITAVQKAISNDGRAITVTVNEYSSTMPTMIENDVWNPKETRDETVESVTVSQIFTDYGITKCKLLKIDCEGCEYEALYYTDDEVWNRIEVFRGEFHEFDELKRRYAYTPARLDEDMKSKFKDYFVSLVKYGEGIDRDWKRKEEEASKKKRESLAPDLGKQEKLGNLKGPGDMQPEKPRMSEKENKVLNSDMNNPQNFFQTIVGLSHDYPRLIWSYWEDESTMPEDVKEMVDVTKRSLSHFTYSFLSSKNVSMFLDGSAFPAFFQKLTAVHKADYYRYSLLEKYGGVYIDASTYVTSGSEMEWFFSAGVQADVELWGFESVWQLETGVILPNFLAAAQYSLLLTNFKKKLDSLLSGDFYQYCSTQGSDRYHCTDLVYNNFFKQNRALSSSSLSWRKRVLELPKERSQYRLQDECGGYTDCVKFRLQRDPKTRKIAFIKLTHPFRTGKKLDFERPLEVPFEYAF